MQLTLHNVVGPHPVSWRSLGEVLREKLYTYEHSMFVFLWRTMTNIFPNCSCLTLLFFMWQCHLPSDLTHPFSSSHLTPISNHPHILPVLPLKLTLNPPFQFLWQCPYKIIFSCQVYTSSHLSGHPAILLASSNPHSSGPSKQYAWAYDFLHKVIQWLSLVLMIK